MKQSSTRFPRAIFAAATRQRAAAAEFQDIFGKENYFAEIMDHGLPDQKKCNKQLLDIAKKLNLPIVATNDAARAAGAKAGALAKAGGVDGVIGAGGNESEGEEQGEEGDSPSVDGTAGGKEFREEEEQSEGYEGSHGKGRNGRNSPPCRPEGGTEPCEEEEKGRPGDSLPEGRSVPVHRRVTALLIPSSFFGPIPLTWSRSSTEEKKPRVLRYSRMARAVAGPTPGSLSSSSRVAVLTFT